MPEVTETTEETPLQKIYRLAGDYDVVSNKALTLAGEIEDEHEAIRKRYKKRLETIFAARAVATENLREAIADAPDATFDGGVGRPRKITIGNVIVGKQKGRGKITGEKDAVRLIPEKFPDRKDELLNVKTTVNLTNARKLLTATELASLGLTFLQVSDVVVIKYAKTGTEKLMEFLQRVFNVSIEEKKS